MQPYQKATEELLRARERPFKTIGAAAGLAIPYGRLIGRAKAFLNTALPENLAVKGLGKIDPKFEKFFKSATEEGFSHEEALNFAREKIGEASSSQENPKESRNIIQQYSPELHSFISEHIGQGRKPLEAGALAQLNDKFKKVIKKMEEDHKTSFSAILQSSYGEGASKGMSKEDAAKRFIKRKKPSLADELTQQFEGYYGAQQSQQPQQQVQGGQGQQALMSIMQKIMQQLGQ